MPNLLWVDTIPNRLRLGSLKDEQSDNMLIKEGLKNKRFGIRRRIKAPDFHETFGNIEAIPAPFNLDVGIFPSFDQNAPNPFFNTPAQPEGCTGMATSKVLTNLWRVAVNPYQPYVETCAAEGVSLGSPVEMIFALNEPVVTGVQVLGEQGLRKTPRWWEVTPVNDSLFMGIVSAMSKGGACVSYAGDWYESYEYPVNGVVRPASGSSSGHDWVFCGLIIVAGIPYLIAEPWLGESWGGNAAIGLKGGFCLFSKQEVDSLEGQAFTPKESPDASAPAPLTEFSVLESLMNFLKILVGLQSGGNKPVFTVWTELENEVQVIKNEISKLMEEKVYECAKNSLGKHMTLNNAVPAEKGCAEAVSAVLALAGIVDGAGGIAGTAPLYSWLLNSPLFEKVEAPEAGAVIISPTGYGNGQIEGHTGIFGQFNTQFPNDWGIMSNDSASGKFLETWSFSRWNEYYGQAGELPVTIFRPL